MSLSDIASINVIKQSTNTTPGQGFAVTVDTFYPCVELRSGKRLWLSQADTAEATEILVQQMRKFLDLPAAY